MLYNAVGAGLDYATLWFEIGDDADEKKGKKITWTAYFEAKAQTRTREKLAEVLDVTSEAVRRWEIRNLVDENNL